MSKFISDEDMLKLESEQPEAVETVDFSKDSNFISDEEMLQLESDNLVEDIKIPLAEESTAIQKQFDDTRDPRELKADVTAAGAAGATALAEEGLKKYAPNVSSVVEKIKGSPVSMPTVATEAFLKNVSGLSSDQLDKVRDDYDIFRTAGGDAQRGRALESVIHNEFNPALQNISEESFKKWEEGKRLLKESNVSVDKSDLENILDGVLKDAGPDIKQHEAARKEILSNIKDLSNESVVKKPSKDVFQEFLPDEIVQPLKQNKQLSPNQVGQLFDSFKSPNVKTYEEGIGKEFKKRVKSNIIPKLSKDAVEAFNENRELVKTIADIEDTFKTGRLEDAGIIKERFATEDTTKILRKYLSDEEFNLANKNVSKLYRIDEVFNSVGNELGLKKAEMAQFKDMMYRMVKTNPGEFATMAGANDTYAVAKGLGYVYKKFGAPVANQILRMQAAYRNSTRFAPAMKILKPMISKTALPAAAAALSYQWAIENGASEEAAAALGALEFYPHTSIASGIGQMGVETKKVLDDFYKQPEEIEKLKENPELYKQEIIVNTLNKRMRKAQEKETVNKQQAENSKQLNSVLEEIKQREVPESAHPYMKLLEEYNVLKRPEEKARKEFILKQQPYLNNKLRDK